MQRGQYSSVKYHLNTKSFYELAEIFIQCSKYHTKMMQIPVYTQFWKSSLSKRSIGIIILLTAWVRHSFNTAMVSVPFMVVPELRDRWQLLLGSAPHLPTMEWLPPIRPLSLVPTMLVPPAALSSEPYTESGTECSTEPGMRPAEFPMPNWPGLLPYPCQELFWTTANSYQ